MFARFIEMTVKLEQKSEFLKKVKEEILPILTKYEVVDLIPLEIETEPTKVFAISLWQDRKTFEKYEKEVYPKVKAILEPFLVVPPVVKICKVDTTIREKVLAVAA